MRIVSVYSGTHAVDFRCDMLKSPSPCTKHIQSEKRAEQVVQREGCVAASGVVAIAKIYGILCLLETDNASHCFAMKDGSEKTGRSSDGL
jgi:hypothetical protein